MRVCVLQPDYSTTDVDYKNYDPPRDLTDLLPGHEVVHVFLNKLTVYSQLKALKKQGYDIYVNLCENYLEWTVPSIDVIYFLDLLNLPYTGPTANLYDPPKELMKYVAYTEGIQTPAHALVDDGDDFVEKTKHLSYPMFVKPGKAGDSLGIDHRSLVRSEQELGDKINELIGEYAPLLVEQYIEGREFTVMVTADDKAVNGVRSFMPVEYVFPEGNVFKTYSLKTSELHPDSNIPVTDKKIEGELRSAAEAVFRGFGGVGYARMDFRMQNGVIYFLEVNFTCSVFYKDEYEGSADYILKYDGIGKSGFLEHIIGEGLRRFEIKQRMYEIRGNAISGYGIYARKGIKAGDIIFQGEGRSQRIITKCHVEKNWSADQIEIFRKYAYPISDEVFILWDENPSEWAPQNHSCCPNTAYRGLNVIAIRDIRSGEELTLDYASFLGSDMDPFNCSCGQPECRGHITGVPLNSITKRESGIFFNK